MVYLLYLIIFLSRINWHLPYEKIFFDANDKDKKSFNLIMSTHK